MKELAASGSKFNAWMEGRILIFADEIKTDDQRDLIEILKPLITERRIEMQGKGDNQAMADNVAMWLFFTNFKNALPKTANDRRYAIFYSPLQTFEDLQANGMDDAYFKAFYDDFLGIDNHGRGLRIIADWLHSYPIERGAIPMRAPQTTSTVEALIAGRTRLQHLIADAVASEEDGFRAGWINTAAVGRIARAKNGWEPNPVEIGAAVQGLEYKRIDQAGKGWRQDDPVNPGKRGVLYNLDGDANKEDYESAQGYDKRPATPAMPPLRSAGIS